MRPRRAFTLIELLIVIAIITVLAGLTVAAAGKVRQNMMIAKARSNMGALQAALSMYSTQYRRLPRLAPRQGEPDVLLQNDLPALYAALMNQPDAGGGSEGPYVKGDALSVGLVLDRAILAAPTLGQEPGERARFLEGEEVTDAKYVDFQRTHGPASAEPLVWLDPWGRPYVYREWDSVSRKLAEAIHRDPPQRGPFPPQSHMGGRPPLTRAVGDRPLDPDGYDLWSAGPNGVNEYGHPDSDDVVVGRVSSAN